MLGDERYRRLFDTMREGYAFCKVYFEGGKARDFRFLTVNRAFETLTGLKDAAGKWVSAVVPGIRESDPSLFEIYGRVALTGNPEKFEIFVAALKQWFTVSAYCPEPEHFVAVFDLITTRKTLEEAQKISEIRYRRLFETAKDGILILDAGTGRITDANPYLLDMLEYSREEILGKKLWEIGPFRDIAASRYAFRKLQRKEFIRYDNLPLETKGHQNRYVEFISNVYRENGVMVIQCNIRDITERHHAKLILADASKELEKRVAERTAELLNANRLMKKMLEKGKRAEAEIKRSREQLRKFSGGLQTLLEEERSRISREIHDELGQALTALKLDLTSIRRRFASEGFAGQSAKILEIERTVNRTIRTVRKISTELRPGILDELGVAAALEWIAKDFQNRTGIGCNVSLKAVEKIPDPVLATAIFRIAQESLTNVTRHARASQVNMSLVKKDNMLILEVKDNGIGIKERKVHDSNSLGLTGIRERVLLLGGEMAIRGKPGKGTLVRVVLPLGKRAGPDA
ncbi:MAG TPA: PAS domain-containing protein [Candidatus Deferrimicrobiaceae bacterium]